ncbi:MAG: Ig-like domain-containing protein [Bacteroidota bacterium]
MRRLVFVLSCLLAAPVGAQPLVVTASTPGDYTASVPTETTLSFTFSEPLGDVTQGLGSAPTLVALPTDAAEIGEITQSDDGATVTFAVTLQPDERYVFLLLDAVSVDGDRLARPFALNLTTGGSLGSLTFRGEAMDSDSGSLDGSLVALVTGDLQSGAVELVAVEVLETEAGTEAFALGPVPFGLYTIGAVRLPFPDPEALAYGFYDPNDDGTPDVLLSFTGNDVTLARPEQLTAGERFEDAQDAAAEAIASPVLIGIAPSTVDEDGRARTWRFQFEGESEQVEVVQVGVFALPLPSTNDSRGFGAMPVPFRDSNGALALADDRGGAAFRAEQEAMGRTVTALLGADPFLSGEREAEWTVRYTSRGSDGAPAESLTVPIPMSTATDREPLPEAGSRLWATNPSRGSLRLGVSVESTEAAEIVLIDARGRTVAVLHRGLLAPGTSVLDTPLPDLVPGPYFVRLTTARGVQTVPVTVVR